MDIAELETLGAAAIEREATLVNTYVKETGCEGVTVMSHFTSASIPINMDLDNSGHCACV